MATDFTPGRRARPREWLLCDDYALVWRVGRAQLVPLAQASAFELETGIASIEALAASIVSRFVKSKRAHLSDDRMADAISYLIGQAWIEAQTFNGSGRLGGFVTGRLRWRLMDWYRDEFEHPASVGRAPIDDLPEAEHFDISDQEVADAADALGLEMTPRLRAILRRLVIPQADHGATDGDILQWNTGWTRRLLNEWRAEVAAAIERNRVDRGH